MRDRVWLFRRLRGGSGGAWVTPGTSSTEPVPKPQIAASTMTVAMAANWGLIMSLCLRVAQSKQIENLTPILGSTQDPRKIRDQYVRSGWSLRRNWAFLKTQLLERSFSRIKAFVRCSKFMFFEGSSLFMHICLEVCEKTPRRFRFFLACQSIGCLFGTLISPKQFATACRELWTRAENY